MHHSIAQREATHHASSAMYRGIAEEEAMHRASSAMYHGIAEDAHALRLLGDVPRHLR